MLLARHHCAQFLVELQFNGLLLALLLALLFVVALGLFLGNGRRKGLGLEREHLLERDAVFDRGFCRRFFDNFHRRDRLGLDFRHRFRLRGDADIRFRADLGRGRRFDGRFQRRLGERQRGQRLFDIMHGLRANTRQA